MKGWMSKCRSISWMSFYFSMQTFFLQFWMCTPLSFNNLQYLILIGLSQYSAIQYLCTLSDSKNWFSLTIYTFNILVSSLNWTGGLQTPRLIQTECISVVWKKETAGIISSHTPASVMSHLHGLSATCLENNVIIDRVNPCTWCYALVLLKTKH